MAETHISWTDYTANFWLGCTKISPGCTNCYAEPLAKNRMGLDVWGPKKQRPAVKGVYANLRKWNRQSDPANPKKVFVGSMMDWAEAHPDAEYLLPTMWNAIRESNHLIFQLLTKRSTRVRLLLPSFWNEIRHRVWLGVSIENADYAYRADWIRDIDCAVRFVSYEPALGPLAHALDLHRIDWVIYGGESGSHFRAEDKQWARDMRDACISADVAFFHKQSAGSRSETGIDLDGEIIHQWPRMSLELLPQEKGSKSV